MARKSPARLLEVPREEDVQQQIITSLTVMGYTVLQTTHRTRRTKCPKCGDVHWPSNRAYGSTPGVPDLMVSRRSWPVLAWLGIEVKRPGFVKWTGDAQKELWLATRNAKAQSVEEAAFAVWFFEKQVLGLEPNTNIIRQASRVPDYRRAEVIASLRGGHTGGDKHRG